MIPQRRAGLGYLFWVTTVREGIDRLLPVASVGGGIAGVRLVGWRGIRHGARCGDGRCGNRADHGGACTYSRPWGCSC